MILRREQNPSNQWMGVKYFLFSKIDLLIQLEINAYVCFAWGRKYPFFLWNIQPFFLSLECIVNYIRVGVQFLECKSFGILIFSLPLFSLREFSICILVEKFEFLGSLFENSAIFEFEVMMSGLFYKCFDGNSRSRRIRR